MASKNTWGLGGAKVFPDAWRALRGFPDNERLAYFDAICRAAIDGEEVEPDALPPMARVVYVTTIDRVLMSKRNADNGKRGGDAKAARAPLRKAIEEGKRPDFKPPEIADVFDYLGMHGAQGVDASACHAHYQKQQWLLDTGEVPREWGECVREYAAGS